MASSGSLTPLQREVLEAFFARERGFCLTGGGALVGFHLHHRTTQDLDLFTPHEDVFERSRYVSAGVAAAIGADHSVKVEAPGFRRVLLARADDAVIMDLVRDETAGQHPKENHGAIRVDSAAEILINKLTTLVGRAEERDLVDVFCLERSGLRVEDAVAGALAKDGGCTPGTLSWILSEIHIPDQAVLPAGVEARELRSWLTGLVVRLRALAMPG